MAHCMQNIFHLPFEGKGLWILDLEDTLVVLGADGRCTSPSHLQKPMGLRAFTNQPVRFPARGLSWFILPGWLTAGLFPNCGALVNSLRQVGLLESHPHPVSFLPVSTNRPSQVLQSNPSLCNFIPTVLVTQLCDGHVQSPPSCRLLGPSERLTQVAQHRAAVRQVLSRCGNCKHTHLAPNPGHT